MAPGAREGAGTSGTPAGGEDEEARRHWRAIEAMYAQAPVQGPHRHKVTVPCDGEAVCAGPVLPEFFHTAGALHGSVLFKMLDDACFFAAQSYDRKDFVGTVSFTTNLLRPVARGSLVAHGKVVNRSRNAVLCEAKLYNEFESKDGERDRKLVGTGGGTFQKMARMPLDRVPGYDRAMAAKL